MPLRGSSRRSTELPPSAEDHSPEFLGIAARHISHTGKLIPAESLELYHRQYWFRLLESIVDDFPGLIRLIGRDRFWAVIEEYLLHSPSHNFTLRYLGSELPAFLAATLEAPAERDRATSVATIEYNLMTCFEAADAPVATPEQIAGQPFTLQPHVSLHSLPADASRWLREAGNATEPADPDKLPPPPERSSPPYGVVIWRNRSGVATHRPLEGGEYEMLARLENRSTTLDPWLEESTPHIPDPETLTRWISSWSGEGFFTPADHH